MIRLAWRQFRIEAVIAAAALVVVAIVLAITGPHLVHVYDTEPNDAASTYGALKGAVYVLALITPALLGVFFGAPLVAENSRREPSASPGPRASAVHDGSS